MFNYDKKLLYDVRVDRPNAIYAALMQEQLGGPHGELKAASQYLQTTDVPIPMPIFISCYSAVT